VVIQVADPLTEAAVWAALAEVPDPEIPLVSIVDLGIVGTVRVHRSDAISGIGLGGQVALTAPESAVPGDAIGGIGLGEQVALTARESAVPGDAISGITRVADAVDPGVDAVDCITVELLPTFVGCPALDVLRANVTERLRSLAPAAQVSVEFSFREPWTTDRISAAGRTALRRSGFAPPRQARGKGTGEGRDAGDHPASLPLLQLEPAVACPHCGSRRTRLESPFGPALCRAVYHCAACRQPFEAFKTV